MPLNECHFKEVECWACKKKGYFTKVDPDQKGEKKSRPNGPGIWMLQPRQMIATGIKSLKCQRERPALLTDDLRTSLHHTCKARTTKSQEGKDQTSIRFCYSVLGSNVRDVELFSIGTEHEDTASETATVIEEPYYVYVGVGCNIRKLYKCRFRKVKLMPTDYVLRTYNKQSLSVRGYLSVKLKCYMNMCTLKLLVVKGNGPALLGRDWIRTLQLDWSSVHRVAPENVEELCDRFQEVFQPR